MKTRKIERGFWYPCVKIKDKGNHVVLNPFALITKEILKEVALNQPTLVAFILFFFLILLKKKNVYIYKFNYLYIQKKKKKKI